MARPTDVDLLCRRWVRAREEDTAAEQVYRPAGFPLPPSRGRTGFVFNADGTFTRIGIGATDISQVSQGTWEIDAADRVRINVGGESETLEIEDLETDRLTIRRVPSQ